MMGIAPLAPVKLVYRQSLVDHTGQLRGYWNCVVVLRTKLNDSSGCCTVVVTL